jgi:MFS family permease
MAGTDHTDRDETRVAPALGRTDSARTDTARTDTVRTDGVPTEGATVTRGAGRDAVAAQHARFGGIKWGAAFFGWLSANGLAVILIAILSAAGVALGLAKNVDTANEAANQASQIGIGGGIAVLVVLFLAYLAGGYVAGRMARFDGARQGLAVWLIGLIVVIVLAAAGAILGAEYNVLQSLNLPRIPIDEGTATTAGIITLVAILLVTLLGAVLGGKLGDRYHRRVDRVGFDAV